MIQELLGGGAALIGGERKISIPGYLEPPSSPTPSPSPSSSTATTNAASSENQNQNQNQNQNLRCPRCDSTNTKFCYYNNYNLTQPRHFCKTCRRYWTKGGALRNVPIGGGCRKNKNITVTASVGAAVKSNTAKLKTSMSCEIGKLGFEGYNHELPPNPILWGPPQSSHLLALLRSNQNHNLIGNPNSVSVKEESVMAGGLSAQTLGLGQFNQIPSVGLCNPFWRSNQSQGQQGGFVLGEVQNYTEIQDLYQRLRSTGNYYPDRHHSSSVMMSNAASSSCCSSILESAPVAAVSGDLGYWNATPSWSDLPTANGAYP